MATLISASVKWHCLVQPRLNYRNMINFSDVGPTDLETIQKIERLIDEGSFSDALRTISNLQVLLSCCLCSWIVNMLKGRPLPGGGGGGGGGWCEGIRGVE